MLRFGWKCLHKLGEVVAHSQYVATTLCWRRERTDKVNPYMVPWWHHWHRVKLRCSNCHFSIVPLTEVTRFNLWEVKKIIIMNHYPILELLTSWLTSLATPGHINLSVTRYRVLFVPKWPDVGSLWHSFRILFRSSLSRMKRTYNNSQNKHVYTNIIQVLFTTVTSLPSFFL